VRRRAGQLCVDAVPGKVSFDLPEGATHHAGAPVPLTGTGAPFVVYAGFATASAASHGLLASTRA
jgi:hypothetical protein